MGGGVGNISGSPTFSGNTMIVNLTGVTDQQAVTVNLTGVMDSFSQTLPATAVSMTTLVGDVTGDGSVGPADIGTVKSQAGGPATAATFRNDIDPNGMINATDVSRVEIESGKSFPVSDRPLRGRPLRKRRGLFFGQTNS